MFPGNDKEMVSLRREALEMNSSGALDPSNREEEEAMAEEDRGCLQFKSFQGKIIDTMQSNPQVP